MNRLYKGKGNSQELLELNKATDLEEAEEERGFAMLNQILRKNILTCVLLGMQHSLYKLHDDIGLPLETGGSIRSLSDLKEKAKRAKMTHVVSGPPSAATAEGNKEIKESEVIEEADVVIDIVEETKSSKIQTGASWKRADGKYNSGVFPPDASILLDKDGLIPLVYGMEVTRSASDLTNESYLLGLGLFR